jgi:hypothetical protein
MLGVSELVKPPAGGRGDNPSHGIGVPLLAGRVPVQDLSRFDLTAAVTTEQRIGDRHPRSDERPVVGEEISGQGRSVSAALVVIDTGDDRVKRSAGLVGVLHSNRLHNVQLPRAIVVRGPFRSTRLRRPSLGASTPCPPRVKAKLH